MNRLDRYILTQLLGPFGFFTLVFAGIIWLTQALGLIDRVIANKQSALIFLEFSTLILPRVLASVLPLAAFGSTLYAVNRLYAESELTVMMATGRSNFRLLVPFVAFGAIVAAMMYSVTLYLNPLSTARLAHRMDEIRNEVANSFIAEGAFVHPSEGVTLYVSDTSRDGEMVGIFLNDQQDAAHPVTYSAQKALLLRENENARMVMFDGIAQSFQKDSGTLTSVRFDQFSYDLGDLISKRDLRKKAPAEYFLPGLFAPSPEMLSANRYSIGDYTAEAHSQISAPLLTLAFPALAFASIMVGTFRRGGIAFRLTIAVVGAAIIQLMTVLAKSIVRADPEFAAVSYLPAILAAIAAVALLQFSNSSTTRRQKSVSNR